MPKLELTPSKDLADRLCEIMVSNWLESRVLIVDESVEKKATENRIDIALFVSFFSERSMGCCVNY